MDFKIFSLQLKKDVIILPSLKKRKADMLLMNGSRAALG